MNVVFKYERVFIIVSDRFMNGRMNEFRLFDLIIAFRRAVQCQHHNCFK